MPDELVRFRLEQWTRPEDVDGFRPPDGTRREVAEARWVHLAAAARARFAAARDRWRADHEDVPLPAGTRRRG